MINSFGKWYIQALCLAAMLFLFAPLEDGSFRFKTVLYPGIWITLGFIVLRPLKDKRNRHFVVKLIIAFGIYVLLTFFFLFRMVFCASEDHGVWYVSKENPSISLICHSFECYQTTGQCTFYKSYKIIGKLRWTTKYADDKVDLSKWRNA